MKSAYDDDWFDIALYYPLEKVNTLIGKSVYPLLEQTNFRKSIDCYHLFFSRRKGDNIRLHFQLKPDAKLTGETLHHINHHFTNFFSTYPADEKPVTLPTEEFFLPFAPNSIRYNTFYAYVNGDFPTMLKHDPSLRSIVHQISMRLVKNNPDQFNLEKFSGKIKFAAAIQIRLIEQLAGANEARDLFRDECNRVRTSFARSHTEAVVNSYIESLHETIKSEAEDLKSLMGTFTGFPSLIYPLGRDDKKEKSLSKVLPELSAFVNYQLQIDTEFLLLLLICRVLEE